MRLMIGGAYQGKRQYVAATYGIAIAEMTDGAELDTLGASEFLRTKCIYHFQHLIKRQLEDGQDFSEITQTTEKILQNNPTIIIIMDEVGSGIIPMEKSEREWREAVGRIGCLLAERAASVERIICGCAVRIK